MSKRHELEKESWFRVMSSMRQMEFFAIPSPCVGVCESGARGFCKGCYRSRDERLHWMSLDEATKRIIVKACGRRKANANKTKKRVNDDDSQSQQDLF